MLSDEQDQMPKKKSQCAFILLLFCLITMCFGINVTVFSMAFQYVDYEELRSAHSPAARIMHLGLVGFFNFFVVVKLAGFF